MNSQINEWNKSFKFNLLLNQLKVATKLPVCGFLAPYHQKDKRILFKMESDVSKKFKSKFVIG